MSAGTDTAYRCSPSAARGSQAPARGLTRSARPFPLPTRRVDLSALRYTVEGRTFDVDGFIRHNHVVGLLVIHDGAIAIERYAQGNTAETTWYSFSVAKSVVSMLVGAAVRDGFMTSVDARSRTTSRS